MLTQCLNRLVDQTPMLSAMRTAMTRWYIVNRWNEIHEEPMDENAVLLFLTDECRGDLTEEQRAFAKARRDELHYSFDRSAFAMLLFQTMSASRLVSGLGDFCKVLSPPGNPHA